MSAVPNGEIVACGHRTPCRDIAEHVGRNNAGELAPAWPSAIANVEVEQGLRQVGWRSRVTGHICECPVYEASPHADSEPVFVVASGSGQGADRG